MKLRPELIGYWLLAGLVLGISASQFLVATGNAFAVSGETLIFSLGAIGILIYFLTLPILRYRLKVEKQVEPKPKRPNPFLSFRLLVLSRAIVLSGSGFVGWHIGQLIWLLTFSVSPAALVTPTWFGMASSVLMLVGGLFAEFNCRLPKDPDGEAVA